MKTFKVTFEVSDFQTYEVLADDRDKAQEQAEKLILDGDTGEIVYGGFEMIDIKEI